MNDLRRKIHAEAVLRGGIRFDRFMELALYCPECGFYERDEDSVGRGGDFHTSVSVGPLLGELLAFQARRWWRASGRERLRLVEAGAHGGRLAADVLRWWHTRHPAETERVGYALLEPSPRREMWQRRRLAVFGQQVEWWRDWPAPAADEFSVILSNELLDALPVRRFGWDAAAGRWFEWGVGGGPERFDWARLPLTEVALAADLPAAPELLAALPDGFTLERNLAAEAWWARAAVWLRCGRLLTLDYGDWPEHALCPERSEGTLRAYRRHQMQADVLADPGEQDLTANVDFRRIAAAGERAGLRTEVFLPQGRWLAQLGAAAMQAGAEFGDWTSGHTRQFQTLTHPDHFGRRFQVLVQERSAGMQAGAQRA
jgi:SAM-dependent MidA family methyltransferase